MKIKSVEPFILHVPVTGSQIADSTHSITHWGVVGARVETEDGLAGYGFTAIIVAFLGRLNPVGILIAGLFLALTFIGGEQAQIAMKIPLDMTKVFQGILLFYVLACDSLILYRIRLIAAQRKAADGVA